MIGVVSATISVVGAIFTVSFGYWWQARLKAAERLDYMGRYRDSLLWAAFDLQSRIYNILNGYRVDRSRSDSRRGFLRGFLLEGTPKQVQYARCSTAYVFAQYLGWAEIFRRDIQFLDLGRNDRTQRTMLLLSSISGTLSAFGKAEGEGFRVFRANQRAIGELMIAPDTKPGERWCLGYAEFGRRVSEDDEFGTWMEELFEYVDWAANAPDSATKRLMKLQHGLVDLIDFLDPKGIRFPAAQRSRYA
jgi:hypothetical protein